MNSNPVEFKTIDNTLIRVIPENVGAIEEIRASSRTEGLVKIYTAGFAFNVALTLEEVSTLLWPSPK